MRRKKVAHAQLLLHNSLSYFPCKHKDAFPSANFFFTAFCFRQIKFQPCSSWWALVDRAPCEDTRFLWKCEKGRKATQSLKRKPKHFVVLIILRLSSSKKSFSGGNNDYLAFCAFTLNTFPNDSCLVKRNIFHLVHRFPLDIIFLSIITATLEGSTQLHTIIIKIIMVITTNTFPRYHPSFSRVSQYYKTLKKWQYELKH